MKKIAFLVNSFGGGGAERNIKYLVDHLVEAYEVHVFVLEDIWTYEISPKATKHVLFNENRIPGPIRILLIPFIGARLKKLMKEQNFSAIVTFLTRSNLIACYAKKTGMGIPLLISERISSLSLYSQGLHGWLGRTLIKQLYKYADIIVPNSFRIRSELQKYFRLRNRIEVVYNPVDIHNIELKGKEDRPVIFETSTYDFINIGRLTSQKNQLLLINAFAKIADRHCRLIILGDGPNKHDLENRVTSLGLTEKILLLPFQKNPYKFITNANCFVLSSDYEGFPNVVLEALACGLPVISTDCSSGPRELLAPGTDYEHSVIGKVELAEYGILVPVGDANRLAEAMQIMRENDGLALRYSPLARKRAMGFDIEHQIFEFRRLINSMIDNVDSYK